MSKVARTILMILLSATLTPRNAGSAQTPVNKKLQTRPEANTEESKAKLREADLLATQQRQFAISLLLSLANEARSYHDLALRARVLARAADTLWDSDREVARTQFRHA